MLGFSDEYSPEAEIKSAKAPFQPTGLTTSISGKNVLIQWTPAHDNFDTVTRYEIEILSVDGEWKQSTLTCDGADETIKAENECLVPLLTLISDDFGLGQGDAVNVRIAATNTIGTSPYTTEVGVLVETVPIAPQAVALGPDTTEQHIEVTWSTITEDSETGGAPILTYRLEWDNGTNQMIWTTLIGEESAFVGTSWI